MAFGELSQSWGVNVTARIHPASPLVKTIGKTVDPTAWGIFSRSTLASLEQVSAAQTRQAT